MRREFAKSATIGVKVARAQLALILGGCSDQALAGFTAEKLASTHRVPLRECEYELTMARQRRGRA